MSEGAIGDICESQPGAKQDVRAKLDLEASAVLTEKRSMFRIEMARRTAYEIRQRCLCRWIGSADDRAEDKHVDESDAMCVLDGKVNTTNEMSDLWTTRKSAIGQTVHNLIPQRPHAVPMKTSCPPSRDGHRRRAKTEEHRGE